MDLGPRRAARTASLLRTLPALVLLGSCSASPGQTAGTDGPGGPNGPDSAAVRVQDGSDAGAGSSVPLRSRVTRVAGQLSDVRRERVARQVRATVQDYLDGAFAASGHAPFRRFQPGLRRAARADEEVLMQPRGATADGTTATRAAAWISVAAPGGRPVGVTVRLRVELAAGSLDGRMILTRPDRRWQVFGYDLARSGPSAPTRRASTAAGGSR